MSITLLPKALRFFYLLFFFFSLSFWLILAVTVLYCRVILCENHCNHSSIYVDFMWLVMWSRVLKGFERKGMKAQKTVCGFFYYSITKSSTWFYERQFKLLLRSFFCPCYFLSPVTNILLLVIHLWFDNILFPFEFSFFLSFFLFLFLKFFLEKILTCAINWISACWWFCLGYFWKKFYFGLKEGAMEILLIIWDGKNMAIYHFESWLLDFQRD